MKVIKMPICGRTNELCFDEEEVEGVERYEV